MILDIIKFIWLLTATVLVWLFYVIPLWLTKNIRLEGQVARFIWKFVMTGKSSWWASKWKDWAGWSGPCVIICRDDLWGKPSFITILRHELRHCWQQAVWGVLFYPAYGLAVAFIWAFMKNKHPYHDNPFERDARSFAGQKVDIPRSEWMHGPNDRIPWF